MVMSRCRIISGRCKNSRRLSSEPRGMRFTVRYDDVVIHGAVDTFVKLRFLDGLGGFTLMVV